MPLDYAATVLLYTLLEAIAILMDYLQMLGSTIASYLYATLPSYISPFPLVLWSVEWEYFAANQ